MRDLILEKLNTIQNHTADAVLRRIALDNKALVSMATGTGKTEVITKILKKYQPSRQVLICAHMEHLIDNIYERLIKYGFTNIGRVDGRYKQWDHDIVVANVMSIGKQSVLDKLPSDKFELIIMDEAHHAAAKSYKRILSKFDAPRIGLTATPQRPDGKSIEEDFGPVMDIIDFDTAQKETFLAKDEAYVILTNSVLKGGLRANGDFSEKALSDLWDTNDRMSIIVNSYKKYGQQNVINAGMKPKALCFCVNTQHAKAMAETFNNSGIKSEHLVSNSPNRDNITNAFMNSHDIEILCVVGLMSEGVDIPDVNILLMTRPTNSDVIYSQQIGRGARRDGGRKKFFVVLDYVDGVRKEYKPKTLRPDRVVSDYVAKPKTKPKSDMEKIGWLFNL